MKGISYTSLQHLTLEELAYPYLALNLPKQERNKVVAGGTLDSMRQLEA